MKKKTFPVSNHYPEQQRQQHPKHTDIKKKRKISPVVKDITETKKTSHCNENENKLPVNKN